MKKISKNIVIVEDDVDLLDTLGMLLEEEGFNVLKFSKAKPVFKKIEKLVADALVIDLMLPDINGDELAAYVKNHERLKNKKVILISADERVIQSAKKAGADAYLKKPFTVEKLINLL